MIKIKVMLNQINFKALAGVVASLWVAYITATGTILNYIKFEDPLNEMAFCVLSLMLALGCIMNLKQ